MRTEDEADDDADSYRGVSQGLGRVDVIGRGILPPIMAPILTAISASVPRPLAADWIKFRPTLVEVGGAVPAAASVDCRDRRHRASRRRRRRFFGVIRRQMSGRLRVIFDTRPQLVAVELRFLHGPDQPVIGPKTLGSAKH